MKPQLPRLAQPDARHNGVTSIVTADLRAVHVLLTRVRYGSLGWHRAGYVTCDDGVTQAPLLLAMALSILEATGVVARQPYERGDCLIVITTAGEALLDRLDAEQFGGAL